MTMPADLLVALGLEPGQPAQPTVLIPLLSHNATRFRQGIHGINHAWSLVFNDYPSFLETDTTSSCVSRCGFIRTALSSIISRRGRRFPNALTRTVKGGFFNAGVIYYPTVTLRIDVLGVRIFVPSLVLRSRGRESVWPVPLQRAPDQNIPLGTRSSRPQHAGRPHNPGDIHDPLP